MTVLSAASTQMHASSRETLRRLGTFGVVLALTILAASMMLRLATVFAVDGNAFSTLSPVVENTARLLHRLSASGVAILALCAVVLCWKQRYPVVRPVKPIAWIVVATVILAIIGPLTPGYRTSLITVLNVTVGMLLLIAFWWLRETAVIEVARKKPVGHVFWATLIVFLLHVATGAASSAWAMRGVRWLAFLHVASVVPTITLIGVVILELRARSAMGRSIIGLMALLTAQIVIGFVLMRLDARPLWLALLHGMLSPLLALALVSMALSRPGHVSDD